MKRPLTDEERAGIERTLAGIEDHFRRYPDRPGEVRSPESELARDVFRRAEATYRRVLAEGTVEDGD